MSEYVGIKLELRSENEDEQKILLLFREAFLLRREKGKDYGDCWKDLGVKKEYVYLYDKVMRLKKLLWEDNKPVNESTRDSLIDLINYAFHTTVLLDEENEKRVQLEQERES